MQILVRGIGSIRVLLIAALLLMSLGVQGEDVDHKGILTSSSKQLVHSTKQYFLEEEMSDGGSRSFGKYYVCAFLRKADSKTYVSFEVYYPDSDQVVFAESLPTSNIPSTDGGVMFKFQFVDNWGNKGSGVLRSQRDSLVILDLTPTLVVSDSRGRNAARQYGDYELSLGNCRPSTGKLHIAIDG